MIKKTKKHKTTKTKKQKNKKTKKQKQKGGGLEQLQYVDTTKKTVVIMGEEHVREQYTDLYEEIIKKQVQIVDFVITVFGRERVRFYTEGEHGNREGFLTGCDPHSCITMQYVHEKEIPIKFSTVTSCNRAEKELCNDEYAADIISMLSEDVDCVIVQMGVLHMFDIEQILNIIRPDVHVILVNTASKKSVNVLRNEKKNSPLYSEILKRLNNEPPYDLYYGPPHEASNEAPNEAPHEAPNEASNESSNDSSNYIPLETFNVIELQDKKGNPIYKCPICNRKARKLHLMEHEMGCPNEKKLPIIKVELLSNKGNGKAAASE
jgi:hypothetical protein